MTSRERLTAIYWGRTPDRPAVKIWGVQPGQECPHPLFEKVRDEAVAKTDLVVSAGSPFNIYAGANIGRVEEYAEETTESPDWLMVVETFRTPTGDLSMRRRKSTRKRPGYQVEHLLKEPEDVSKLLSIAYEPTPFSGAGYKEKAAAIGERGLVMFGLDHPLYALQRLIGSENFALWSLDHEALLLEAVQVFARRVRAHAAAAIEAGIRGAFGWVGPELCIPPLMPPSAFEKYVFDFDKPLIDLILDAGGRVWVHCHGRMGPVLERFADMGVDVLNPIEPPPMGDVTLEQAFDRVGDRMALEGNIETHDLMTGNPDMIRRKVREALEAGRGRRLILCPSSGYTESVVPTGQEIENWMAYIDEGVTYAESMR